MAKMTLRQRYEEARDLIRRGRPDQAIGVCRLLLERFPRHLASYRLLGQACLIQGDYEGAADIFRRVLSADPQDLAAYAGLAVIHEEEGELDEAIWYMQRAFELASGNSEIRTELTRLCRQGDIALPGGLTLTRAALAQLYGVAGEWWRTVAECRSVLATDPGRTDVRLLLAEALWRGGQRQEALQTCQEILAELPHCLKANLMCGTALTATDPSAAEICFNRAQALDPENRTAQQLLGPECPLTQCEIILDRGEEGEGPAGSPTAPERDEAGSTETVKTGWQRALR